MLIVVLTLATVLIGVWIILLNMATNEDWIIAAYNKVLDNLLAIDKLRLKDAAKREKLAEFHGITAAVMGLFLKGNSEKEIAKLQTQNKQLQDGNLKVLGVFAMPGYALTRKIEAISRGSVHKTIFNKNFELYGKKYAEIKTKQLLAQIISYSIIGVAVALTLGATVMAAGNFPVGAAIMGIGTILVLVLVYAMYDDISDQVNRRRDIIARQFPNAVSKLALLVTSGMIMDRAWKETAYSHESELYREMQFASQELENLVSPEEAYGGFIKRCNTKETAKLASAIIQNLSKGNTEIGRLLKDMAREAWLERRHIAKRDSEKANSKLMIPTMLLFGAILVMIMVPVVINFTGL